MSLALWIAFLTVLALATWPLVRELRRSGSRSVRTAAFAAWVAGLAALVVAASLPAEQPLALRTAPLRPLEVKSDGYVSSDACQACHPDQYDSWYDSYHRRMAQLASEESVRAPFDGVELVDLAQREAGAMYSLSQRGDEFWVELDDPLWSGKGAPPRVERQVVQVTGSHHQQIYWMASGIGRALIPMTHGYRIDEGRWRPIDAIFLTPPRGVQSTMLGRWNTSCQKCHATHGKARFEDLGSIDTHVAELGIACEMCHGPAEEHVAANRDPRHRYRLHASGEADPTIVDPADLTAERSAMVCGQCHGVTHLLTSKAKKDWIWNGFAFRPGDDLTDTCGLGEIDAERADRKFWDDGMVRVTGREFNALARTPCFQAGAMSCVSCHRLHQAADDPRPREQWANDQLAPGMDGDAACTQCHEEYLEPETLARHTHHEPESSGSRCLDCHMPFTTYGLLGAIRNHEVEPPDVAASIATGRPNACNQCHLDRTLAWTAEKLAGWYGTPVPALDEEQRTIAASVLWTLRGEAGQRALLAWSFGWKDALRASGSDWVAPYLSLLLEDPYHAVRFVAARSAKKLPEFEGIEFDYLAPEDERFAASQRFLERWALARAADEPARPALLLDEGGVWLEERVSALLERRNTEDIVLQE